jgi:hypothetical protein
MSDESRRVLEMLSQGKVTVEEADQLLAALAPPPAASAKPGVAAGESSAPKYLRITVTRTRGGLGEEASARRSWMWPGYEGEHRKEVTMRVPITLLKNGMRLGAILPGIYG